MGYDVQLTGRTNRRDGGIDLIAVPKIRTIGSFLIAAQIKHHRGDRTTGRPDVDRLLAWKDSPFRIGLMVTNTSFSQDARWLADQVNNRAFLRLRDFEDLKRWLRGQFDLEFDWRELPDVVSLAPGITVRSPQGPTPELAGYLAFVRHQDGRQTNHLNQKSPFRSVASCLFH
jgi:Restriction endonuclease